MDPLQVLNDVVDIIRNEVPIYQNLSAAQKEKNIREYDDEFKTESTSWQFGYPAAFVRLVKGLPRFKYVDGGSEAYDYDMVIFICHDGSDSGNTHILDVVKQVRTTLEGQELVINGEDLKIQCGQFDFFDKVNKVAIYTLDIGTIP